MKRMTLLVIVMFVLFGVSLAFGQGLKVIYNLGSPEGIAIDLTTHDLFINSSLETESEGSESGSDTGVEPPGPPEPPGGDSVIQVDPINMTLAEIGIHAGGEYVAVNSTTGLVYHAGQITNEIAVINGRTGTTLGYIPLVFQGESYQPYQIAIDEKQNLIYVGAKAPPIVDPPYPGPDGKFPCKAIHEMPDDEYDCWNPGKVFVIDGNTNQLARDSYNDPIFFKAGDDPEGVVFAAKTGKVYASNEDDGSITVAKGARRTLSGRVTAPYVLSTIIRGEPVPGWWQPTCDENNYCGERGQAALWPALSLCNGIDDEAEEADKMAVDEYGNVYIIDDRYRVAKINGQTDRVVKVLAIDGFDCEAEVPDGSNVVFRNTANNIAYMQLVGKKYGLLYVTSEQDTVSVINPGTMTLKATLTIPGAVELDAITTDPWLKRVYITDEGLGALWILQGGCANGNYPSRCKIN